MNGGNQGLVGLSNLLEGGVSLEAD
jgi:hypothetical protein